LAVLFGRISVRLCPDHPIQCHFRCYRNTDIMVMMMKYGDNNDDDDDDDAVLLFHIED
jgi:hypothetical protein